MELEFCETAYGDRGDGRCAWCGDLLPPRRARWCSAACSHLYSINHVWSAARRHALAQAGYSCEECGATELEAQIEVHHFTAPVTGRRKYGHGCWHHQTNLEVLCKDCHDQETRIERQPEGTVLQLQLRAS